MVRQSLFLVFLTLGSALASSEESDMSTFDCTRAPEVLGYPDAEVVTCGPFYESPNLVFAWLRTADGKTVKRLLLPSDPPFLDVGLAAAGRFLEEGGLDRNRQLDEHAALLFIKVAEARPPGWTEMEGIGKFPGVGQSGFNTNPFSLTLIRVVGPPPTSGSLTPSPGLGLSEGLQLSGQGHTPPGPRLYQRAVLSRSGLGGVWQWEISDWVNGDWEPNRVIDLR